MGLGRSCWAALWSPGRSLGSRAGRNRNLTKRKPQANGGHRALRHACIFHTPIESTTVRRVRARGLHEQAAALVGRVPSGGGSGVKYAGSNRRGRFAPAKQVSRGFAGTSPSLAPALPQAGAWACNPADVAPCRCPPANGARRRAGKPGKRAFGQTAKHPAGAGCP